MNKVSGGDEIPVELLEILKDDAVKVLYSKCQKIWKHSTVTTGLERVSFHSNPKEGNAKECTNYRTMALNSRTTKAMLKILQARLQQYVNHEFQMFKLDLEKREEPEIKLPTSVGSKKRESSSREISTLLYWLCQSLSLCGSQKTVVYSERDGNTRPPDLPPEISVSRSRSSG